MTNLIDEMEMKRAGVRAIYTATYLLDRVELWSGGDRDPEAIAHMDSERMAIGDCGEKLPYDVTFSFPALQYARGEESIELMEDLEKRVLLGCQRVCCHVVVFENEQAWKACIEAKHSFIKVGR